MADDTYLYHSSPYLARSIGQGILVLACYTVEIIA
jgi:hypothetical protein